MVFSRGLSAFALLCLSAPVLSLPQERAEPVSQRALTFSNRATDAFFVNGSTIPTVPFDAGDSWAGLLPISSSSSEKRKLFFWLWPAQSNVGSNDLVIWLNGGPGCSSMQGFLQENGPISFKPGATGPTLNPYSWTNASNVMWIDQPIGVGYSQGKPDITNDVELADQFVGWLEQFLSTFTEFKGKNIWLTGESFAGMYIPYIADHVYGHPELKAAGMNLQGILLFDASTSYNVVLEQIPTIPFVHKWNDVLKLNSSFVAQIETTSAKCGYTNYSSEYVTYPPKGPLPLPPAGSTVKKDCDIYNAALAAAKLINPCFNIYHITDICPKPADPLHPKKGGPTFFQDPAIQEALHVPVQTNWTVCGEAYIDTDHSPRPAPAGVLTRVIDNSTRVLIGHGLVDMRLFSDGTRIMLQNLTFGGVQGFQSPIDTPFTIDGQGQVGVWHQERNLLYAEFDLAGHEVPEYTPLPALVSLQWLLGQITSL